MALQGSGAISLADLATEFGDTAPYSMSEYYRDGGKVPGNNTGVPTSGAIGLGHFYNAVAAIVLDITSNTSNYNILTAATAAGYNAATDTTPIIVNVAAGVNVTGSGTYAMRTGALNAGSDLTINVASTAFITGYTGAKGANGSTCSSPNGQTGAAGGDAIYFETATGGSGTYAVVNAGTIRSGGGGGGGGGAAGQGGSTDKGNNCYMAYGSSGSSGSNGGYGQNGTSGGSGTNSPDGQCNYCAAGSGGAGGAAGYAVRKNGRTVTTSGAGTYTGATA